MGCAQARGSVTERRGPLRAPPRSARSRARPARGAPGVLSQAEAPLGCGSGTNTRPSTSNRWPMMSTSRDGPSRRSIARPPTGITSGGSSSRSTASVHGAQLRSSAGDGRRSPRPPGRAPGSTSSRPSSRTWRGTASRPPGRTPANQRRSRRAGVGAERALPTDSSWMPGACPTMSARWLSRTSLIGGVMGVGHRRHRREALAPLLERPARAPGCTAQG